MKNSLKMSSTVPFSPDLESFNAQIKGKLIAKGMPQTFISDLLDLPPPAVISTKNDQKVIIIPCFSTKFYSCGDKLE